MGMNKLGLGLGLKRASASSPGAALLASLIEEFNFEDGPVTWTGSKAAKVLTDAATASGSDDGVIANGVNVPDSEYLGCTDAAFVTASFTLETFYKRTVTNANSGSVLRLGSGVGRARFLDTPDDDSFSLLVFNSLDISHVVRYQGGVVDLEEGVWHHIVGTYDGTSKVLKLYVDGVSQGSETLVGTLASSNGLLEVSDGSSPNVAQFDLLRYFNRAITDAEVSYLYNSGAGRRLTS